jgi:hemolysin activation/secretion protein
MRTVCVFFVLMLPVWAFSQTYKVSELKFDNFKAYEQYDISLESIRAVLLNFSKKNPQFEQSGLFILAAELSELYRAKGLAFHRVEVVLGRPVRLVLVPGIMASIDVRGNQRYKDEQIEPFFDDLFGRLVDNKTLQTAMARMNSLPGLEGFAFLSFGQSPGEAVLNVSASKESWGQVSTRLNNFGSSSTGDYRLNSQLTLNNPLKLSEQWRIGGSVSDAYENWGANLAVDFHGKGLGITTLSGQFQNMALVQDFDLLNMSGWQASGQLSYKRTPTQTLKKTANWQVSAGFLQQSLANDSNITSLDIALQDIPVRVDLSGDFAGNKTYLGYQTSVGAGYLLQHESSIELPNDYWAAAQFDLSFAQSITGGVLQKGVDLKSRLQGQYALDALPSHRRFGLSGSNKLGAYQPGAYTADTGLFNETSLTLLNLELGWFQTVWQGIGQAGWGQTGDSTTDWLFNVGGSIDIDVGPLNTQVKAFSDENFESLKVLFEVTLDWPKGR